jgi:septal ring factor EnvC (AmiA/AmiB activator)
MNSKRLNDELTIIGLIFILAYALFTSYQYSNRLLEAQKAVIHLDKKLTKAEVKLDETNEYLKQTKAQLLTLSKDVSKLQHLDRVKKDIDRNLWPDKR